MRRDLQAMERVSDEGIASQVENPRRLSSRLLGRAVVVQLRRGS